jgi:tryptophan synthase alpha chain
VADGLIVGSAIVRRVAEADSKGRDATIKAVGDYLQSLLSALDS